MSRSRKKPWVGDSKWHEYCRPIRRIWKTILKTLPPDTEPDLPSPKEIINDYDYQDYKWYINEKSYTRK